MIETATQGTVYTFYSFKGGVGRTMALANVAALLAKWGHSVLVVDWDLEAPGIERFFFKDKAVAKERRTEKPGIVDLVIAKGNGQPIDWQTCVHELTLNGSPRPLSLITAGKGNGEYIGNLQKLSFPELFEKSDLGAYIESLRDEWISRFDFVLVDSRTGVTDIGGICTVLLADILVLLFTTTDSSTDGVLDIMKRAREARQHIPRDRQRLIAIPVPARDESRTEYESAKVWREKVAERFGDLYTDWLPTGVTAHDALEILKIPYVPYWSFGERLPVIEEGTGDPASLGYAYEVLAKIVASKLDWEVVKGQSTASQTKRESRQLDPDWLTAKRRRSGTPPLSTLVPGEARIEIYHYCVDVFIERSVKELLQSATKSMTKRGHPTGEVRHDASRPRPVGNGIAAFPQGKSSPNWILETNGDFYTLRRLHVEDSDEVSPFRSAKAGTVLFADCQINDVTEALIHCVRLYEFLEVSPTAKVHFAIGYGGIAGRELAHFEGKYVLTSGGTALVNHAASSIEFVLKTFEKDASKLVTKLCERIFEQFDFAEVSDEIYTRIVNEMVTKYYKED